MFKMVVRLQAGVMIGLGPTKNKLAPRPFWQYFFFLKLETFQLLYIFSHNDYCKQFIRPSCLGTCPRIAEEILWSTEFYTG